jgi:predicted GNAT superfamily acetyltransferase
MRIREATSHEDLDEVAKIQVEVWNVEDIDIASRIILRASQHAGGAVLVAEADDGAIAGFAWAFPAYEHGETFWHSDMLAVRPAYRAGRIGQALKWAQRDRALEMGLRRITWTFDPMQARNAHLNLELLGATTCQYLDNFYGVTTSDLHHGLPTDRLLASWDLTSPRVEARARGIAPARPAATATVRVPPEWNALVARDPGEARREQARAARDLKGAFAGGLTAIGFDKASASYLLSPAKPS